MSLKECKIKDFDDIFETTRLSLGYDDAVNSILYVLFDISDGKKTMEDKYRAISRDKNARKKAMLMQKEDLAHILIKYCMASFGLRNKWFSIGDDDLFEFTKNIDSGSFTGYELIEYFAYASMFDVTNAYDLLYRNTNILEEVIRYMLNERYGMFLKNELDSFTGLINNDKIDRDLRYQFYDSYFKLDDEFEEIKRNSPLYIR